MNKLYTCAIKKELSRDIKGDISVHTIGDMLVIDIVPIEGLAWRYTLNKLSQQMRLGMTGKIIADEVYEEYMRFILSEYFYCNH